MTAINASCDTLSNSNLPAFLYKSDTMNLLKGQLQRFYKLMSYERVFKMLKNDMCITKIGQAVLKL